MCVLWIFIKKINKQLNGPKTKYEVYAALILSRYGKKEKSQKLNTMESLRGLTVNDATYIKVDQTIDTIASGLSTCQMFRNFKNIFNFYTCHWQWIG